MTQPPNTTAALTLLIPCGIAYAIACILLFSRIYARVFITRRVHIDDYLIIVAGVCSPIIRTTLS
jgi:hypothetical protein